MIMYRKYETKEESLGILKEIMNSADTQIVLKQKEGSKICLIGAAHLVSNANFMASVSNQPDIFVFLDDFSFYRRLLTLNGVDHCHDPDDWIAMNLKSSGSFEDFKIAIIYDLPDKISTNMARRLCNEYHIR